MTETLLFVGIGSILLVGVATLGTVILTLRSARRYVELAEERMECLREGQARLLRLLHEERQRPKEGERYSEAQQPAGKEHEEREWPIHTRQDSQPFRKAQQKGHSFPFEEPGEDTLEYHEFPRDEMSSWEETPRTEKPPASSSKAESEPQKNSRKVSPEENRRPPLSVWHPHPDDDVTPRTSAGQFPVRSYAPMKMFHTIYDRYLDNYEGYVKLVERLYLARDNNEAPAGSPAEREWEEKLRRVNDGIERTVARLDILEGSNPELATDDRVSQRASIAQSHSDLTSQRPRRGAMDKERVDIFTGA